MTAHPIPNAALDDRLGFIGTSGSGKTYNAGGAIERLLRRKARVVIVDPLGVWWGLRLLADGKTQSPYDVAIFGGPHGDLPLNEHAGALIGETAATMAESCIIDLSQLGTKSAERRFMTAFLETIYRKATGEPFHLVVDESDLFAPQKPPKGDETLLNLMEQIVRRGRVKGFIPWLISQRPAVLNKNVLSQVDGLIAFKLTASQDRDALDGWIEGQADKAQGKAIKDGLPALQVGRGIVWVPGRGVLNAVTFPAKETFDSSRTPKRGEKQKSAATLKPLDLGALKSRLATVVAETKANDPKALKVMVAEKDREIRRLQAELTSKSTTRPPPDKNAIAAAEQRGFEQARKKLNRSAEKAAGEATSNFISMLEEKLQPLIGFAREARAALRSESRSLADEVKFTPSMPAVPATAPIARSAIARMPTRGRSTTVPEGDDAGALTNPMREVLKSLAWWSAMGHRAPTRAQVAAIAGWKPRGSNLRNRLTELSTAGLIVYPRQGTVQLAPAGAAAAPDPDTSSTLIENIRRICSKPMLTVFDAILESQSDGVAEVTRDELAQHIGWEPGGSNLRNRLTELSVIEVIHYPSRGTVALQDWVTEMRAAA